MARIIVMPDLENGHPAPIVFDEQVSAIHVDNKHSAFQLIERLAWAIHDAEEIEQFILNAGECMDIPPGLVHQMEALEDAELYEFSTQHFNSDSHRLVKGD